MRFDAHAVDLDEVGEPCKPVYYDLVGDVEQRRVVPEDGENVFVGFRRKQSHIVRSDFQERRESEKQTQPVRERSYEDPFQFNETGESVERSRMRNNVLEPRFIHKNAEGGSAVRFDERADEEVCFPVHVAVEYERLKPVGCRYEGDLAVFHFNNSGCEDVVSVEN